MNVLVASIEDSSFDFQTTVYSISYEAERHTFSMPRPMGDDWFQRVSHSPSKPPKLVRLQEHIMVVVFESLRCAEDFCSWLLSAEAEAQEGYRTMRG